MELESDGVEKEINWQIGVCSELINYEMIGTPFQILGTLVTFYKIFTKCLISADLN